MSAGFRFVSRNHQQKLTRFVFWGIKAPQGPHGPITALSAQVHDAALELIKAHSPRNKHFNTNTTFVF